jgi:hypothetical protein
MAGKDCTNQGVRMKKILFLYIFLVLVYTFLFCSSEFFAFAINYSTISETINNALELKEAGDIEGAILSIQRTLEIINTVDTLEKGQAKESVDDDMYTKDYLQTLIQCLKADEITYRSVIRYNASIAKKTSTLFREIAEELKTGRISPENATKIKEMKLEMSKAQVTHSFCVPPEGYQQVYEVTQQALFRYTKAWRNLYFITLEETEDKDTLEAEALINFQKGNELFSQAGTLMLEIPQK